MARERERLREAPPEQVHSHIARDEPPSADASAQVGKAIPRSAPRWASDGFQPQDALAVQRLVGNRAATTMIRRALSNRSSHSIGPEGGQVDERVSQRIRSQQGSGEPVATDIRTQMEASLGSDFSGVRVHTGSESADLNADLGARAFTTGSDIFLGQGTSQTDRHVLAHELTHVVQQQSMSASGPLTVGRADDAYERAADDVADSAAGGGALSDNLRRITGNHAAEGTLNRKLIQRHPEGAAMSDDPDAASQELIDPPDLDASQMAAEPLAPEAEAPDGGTAPEAGGTPGPAPKAPASPAAMTLSKAQTVLDQSYGNIHKMVPGNITFVEGQPALWAKYDEVCLRDKCTNPHTNKAWKTGDAQASIPGLQGFADKGTGTVYVNHYNPLPTATAHEMLHLNTASDFRTAVGETINEGMTEHLALNALTAAGIPTTGTGGAQAYPMQREAVAALAGLVGEDVMVNAYFKGSATLVDTYEALHGKGTWAALKTAMEGLDKSVYEPLLKPPSTEQRIAAINGLLDGGPTPHNVEVIENMLRTPGTDLNAVGAAIRPRLKDIADPGAKRRIMNALGLSDMGDYEPPEPPAGPGSAYA